MFDEQLGRRGALQAVALEDISTGLRALREPAQEPEPDVGRTGLLLRDLVARCADLAEKRAGVHGVAAADDRPVRAGYRRLPRLQGPLIRLCPELLRADLVRLGDGMWLDVLTWSCADGEERLMARAEEFDALHAMHELLEDAEELGRGEIMAAAR